VLPRRYLPLILTPLALVVVGTLGYWLIEKDYTLFDALYMTITTLTTVGYGEVHPLTPAGRVFTMVLLLGGVFTLFYTATEIIRIVVSGEVQGLLGRRRMERQLAALKNHIIVCGYGRMGKAVCREFSKQKLPFVVVDRSSETFADFDLESGLYLVGDATDDVVLRRAGVERARALVTVAASDADNLYITLSARLLNESLFIVARAEADLSEQKLGRAGANRVVSPYSLSGFNVAQAVLRPNVVDFIDLATRTEHLELQMEEVNVRAGSRLAGRTLQESQMRHSLGIIIVAIKKASGPMQYNPSGGAVMEPDDTLIALGRPEQLAELDKLATAGE
jgi:voltage-gated potassium channel